MPTIRRRFAHLPIVLSILVAASLPIAAQEIRDRKLIPDYDFSTVQMPVEIVSIKVQGKEIVPGDLIKGNDDWLQGVSFTLKNISDTPIAYVNLGFKFPRPNGFVVYFMSHGVDWRGHGETRREHSPSVIQPGQTRELVLTKDRYNIFLDILAQAGAARSFDTAPYYIETISFADDPDVIWRHGFLLRRHDPTQIDKFDVIGRYVLPTRQN